MGYTHIEPPVYLKDYIQFFWTLESEAAETLPKTIGPLADGCPGIILQKSENGIYYDQQNKQLPEVFLYGQTVTRTSINLTGSFKTLGVCFFPNTLKYIFGFDAYEITDSCLDLSLLPKKRETSLSEQLLNASSTENQIEILSAYLFSEIRKKDNQVDHITSYAVAQIVHAKGNVSLKELQEKLDLSERSFQRKFKQEVGISPKLFSKVCRFQASLAQLRNNHYSKLSDIAYDNGYADQPHFIRNFKEFAGFPPYHFQKQSGELPENFVPLLIK